MICAPIDTDGPRFRVITIEGYPITRGGVTGGTQKPVLVATVLDSFYGTEHGRYASNDTWRRTVPWKCGEGEWVAGLEGRWGRSRQRGREGALAAAEARCAELNAWHEREGWSKDVPLAS